MAPAKRHEIFYKMGLRLVDFDYVQAPLFRDKKKVNFLLLCCFITEKIPKIENKVRALLFETLTSFDYFPPFPLFLFLSLDCP